VSKLHMDVKSQKSRLTFTKCKYEAFYIRNYGYEQGTSIILRKTTTINACNRERTPFMC